MKRLFLALILCLAGCGPKAEFAPETVEAYQTDNGLRSATLAKCSAHAANHQPFATQSDTDECQKAGVAQANVNYAAHRERERQANDRVANEINQLAGSSAQAARH